MKPLDQPSDFMYIVMKASRLNLYC